LSLVKNEDALRKKFLINLALLLFVNLLVKPFWIFGIDRGVQNVVGSTEYGLYFSLFNFSILLNILLDLGITNYNNRNISQYDYLVTKHFSNVVVLKFLLGVVYFTVNLIIAVLIGYNHFQIKLLIFLLFNQFLLSLILYMRSNISALQYFTIDSLISVLDRTLMIIIVGVLLWGHITQSPFKIEWFVYSQTAAYLITALVTFIILNSKIEKVKLNFDFSFFIVFLKKSYPYALLILLMTFYYRIDSVMIERMLPDGKEQAGIYAQSFRILDAVSMIAFLFSTLLLPMFSRMIKSKENISGLLNLSFHLLIVPALLFSITSYFFSKEIISLLYYSHIQESSRIFAVLMISFIFISISYIYGTLLTANGSIKELNYIAASGMVINVVLNFILIPYYKSYGATIASVITQGITAMLQVYYAHKIFKLGYPLKKLLRLLVFIFLVFVITFVLRQYQINWLTEYFSIIFASLIIALLLKVLDLKGMYKIIKGVE
jgi:O-antigen/teichoic acid export membrane protein